MELSRELELIWDSTDLSWHKGLKNTGMDAEVYAPQSGPNGLIKVTVARSQTAAKL
jgi:urate oxidase